MSDVLDVMEEGEHELRKRNRASKRGWGKDKLFPLTPARSLGERVPISCAGMKQVGSGIRTDWREFSLSPRERVGVRGKRIVENSKDVGFAVASRNPKFNPLRRRGENKFDQPE